MANFTCHHCGKRVSSGVKYPYEGHSYCYECYQELLKQLQESTNQKQALYTYIKKLYNVNVLPDSVINMLDQEIKSGRKIAGLRKTFYYYGEVKGLPLDDVNKAYFVIRDYYNETRDYFINIEAVRRYNADARVSNTPKVIRVDRNKIASDGHVPAFDYNIEDL